MRGGLCLVAAALAVAEVSWNAQVPPNEATGPWRFKERDPFVEGWRRDPGDERVAALREQLMHSNCMDDLVTFSAMDPDFNVTVAASFFDKHGFLVLEDALSEPLLQNLKNASGHIMEKIFEKDPEGSFGGGAGKLPHRYSLGDASATKSNFHLEAYSALVDLPSTTPLLQKIFGSNDYFAAGCGGDVVLAGAIEYQSLHPDAIWGILDGHVADQKLPPAVTINFVLENLTAINGAMRLVPGSHRLKQNPPNLLQEPDSSTPCVRSLQELPFSGTIDVGTAVHQTSPTRCESCQTWNTSRPRPCHLWVGWTGLRCPGIFFLAFHLLDSISPGQWWHRRGKKFQGWALTHRQRSLISCLFFDEPRKSWQNLTHGDPSFNHV